MIYPPLRITIFLFVDLILFKWTHHALTIADLVGRKVNHSPEKNGPCLKQACSLRLGILHSLGNKANLLKCKQ